MRSSRIQSYYRPEPLRTDQLSLNCGGSDSKGCTWKSSIRGVFASRCSNPVHFHWYCDLRILHSQCEIIGRRPKLRETRCCSTCPRFVPNSFLAELGLPSIDSAGPQRYGGPCPQGGVLHPLVHKGLARNFFCAVRFSEIWSRRCWVTRWYYAWCVSARKSLQIRTSISTSLPYSVSNLFKHFLTRSYRLA